MSESPDDKIIREMWARLRTTKRDSIAWLRKRCAAAPGKTRVFGTDEVLMVIDELNAALVVVGGLSAAINSYFAAPKESRDEADVRMREWLERAQPFFEDGLPPPPDSPSPKNEDPTP